MKEVRLNKGLLAIGVAAAISSGAVVAGDVAIGEASKNGMGIAAVYIQPTMM